jgi:adenylate cyclase
MMRRSRIDFEAEGLLDGLEGDARDARLGLLEDLAADGVGFEELREAVQQNRLALLPVERVLTGDGPRFTPRQVSELSGVEIDLLQDLYRALGLPRVDRDQPGLDEHDLESAKRLRGFREAGIADNDILDMSRAIGMAMASIAEGTREILGRTLISPGDDERDLALRFAMSAQVLGPEIAKVLQYVLNRHLRDQVHRDVIAAGGGFGPDSGGTEVCVCFADLVGFTKLGERLPGEELGRVAGRLAELASEAAEPPVRLIKLIGDAAMLVSPDAVGLLDAALKLASSADEEGEGFPQVRAGVASGEAIGRGGDWYGRPVNLASRVTDIARPGSVLASEAATEMAGGAFTYSFAGERRLKGLDSKVRLYRVRRRGEETPGS